MACLNGDDKLYAGCGYAYQNEAQARRSCGVPHVYTYVKSGDQCMPPHNAILSASNSTDRIYNSLRELLMAEGTADFVSYRYIETS